MPCVLAHASPASAPAFLASATPCACEYIRKLTVERIRSIFGKCSSASASASAPLASHAFLAQHTNNTTRPSILLLCLLYKSTCKYIHIIIETLLRHHHNNNMEEEETYPRGWDYNKRFTEHFKLSFFGNKISIKQSPSGSSFYLLYFSIFTLYFFHLLCFPVHISPSLYPKHSISSTSIYMQS